MGQDVSLTADTYHVRCKYCGNQFDVPRKYRKNKRTLKEDSSMVNVRVGWTVNGDTMRVGWTVQSAEKRNQYMERQAVDVDVSSHPEKLFWHVAVFKMLQHSQEYKSARIWVKDQFLIDHVGGNVSVSSDDLREHMKTQIVSLCQDKFLDVEFGKADTVGKDMNKLLYN